MFSTVALNAFCQSTFDQSFVVDEIGVPSIDENDIDDDNTLELDIFRHEKEEKKEKDSYVVDEFHQSGGSGAKGKIASILGIPWCNQVL
jgi:hypothetical protein